MVKLSACQTKGYSKTSAFADITTKAVQQDTVVAAETEFSSDTPDAVLDVLLDIENQLVDDTIRKKYRQDFDTTATLNSVYCDGNGRVSIQNATVGDSLTHVYLVDRTKGTVEILSHEIQNGQLWLGAAFQGVTDQSVENATNSYDIELSEGQELHILSCSDGIAMNAACQTLEKSDMSFHRDVVRYLKQTPADQVDLAQYVTEKSLKLGTQDNASATVQTLQHNSAKSRFLTGVFDANGGQTADIDAFRQSVDNVLKKHFGMMQYTAHKDIDQPAASNNHVNSIARGAKLPSSKNG